MTTLPDLMRADIPLRTDRVAVYPYKPALERKYRFFSRFGDEVLLHKKVGDEIHLPRALCPVGEKDMRDNGDPAKFPKGPVPRPNQVKLFDQVQSFLEDGLSGVVVAPTGFGKTVIGYHAAYILQKKTLVITTKEDIFNQWVGGACGLYKQPNFLGLRQQDVGIIRGDKCEVLGTKFCVALIQSLSRPEKYPDWITTGFGLVIFDECHRVPADGFSTVATMFPARYRIGLSATPDRSDGKELLVYSHIGPKRAEAEAQHLVPKVIRYISPWQCPRYMRTDPETGQKSLKKMAHSPGKTTHVEKTIAIDDLRNKLLVEIIKECYDVGRDIVVFSTLLDHLATLMEMCRKAGVPAKEMGIYQSAQTKDDKAAREQIKVRKIKFTTYAMMSEGTSIDWLDTCILAMPRSKVTQPIGRIRREYPGKKSPVVIDILDNDSPVFAGYGSKRRDWYRSIDCEIVDMFE